MAIVFSAKITGVSVENMYSTGNYYTGTHRLLVSMQGMLNHLPFENRIRTVLGGSRRRSL